MKKDKILPVLCCALVIIAGVLAVLYFSKSPSNDENAMDRIAGISWKTENIYNHETGEYTDMTVLSGYSWSSKYEISFSCNEEYFTLHFGEKTESGEIKPIEGSSNSYKLSVNGKSVATAVLSENDTHLAISYGKITLNFAK